MSYTITKTVPRVTNEHISKIHTIVPGLGEYVAIPMLQNEKQAEEYLTRALNSTLPRHEYVTSVSLVSSNDMGFTFKFNIAGD